MGDETTAAVGMGVGAARLIELFMDNVLVDAIVSTREYYGSDTTWGTKNASVLWEREAATCHSRKNTKEEC